MHLYRATNGDIRKLVLGHPFADLCEFFAFFAVNFLYLPALIKAGKKQDNRKERKGLAKIRKGCVRRIARFQVAPHLESGRHHASHCLGILDLPFPHPRIGFINMTAATFVAQ
jgi:hypothetical protein